MSHRALADRNAVSQSVARQMLETEERDPNIRYSHALPQRGEEQLISALLSVDMFEYISEYASTLLAVAATRIAADLAMTTGSDSSVACQN